MRSAWGGSGEQDDNQLKKKKHRTLRGAERGGEAKGHHSLPMMNGIYIVTVM